ncbi:hypothetical protein MNBD_GAMMA09-1561 [hydrothermal vent metagenome]|uniref:Uncharacterized protein n=1 Tax=hydrothermal vent metagenome TaxID=652676 RepID=A0A3B0Y253_9ZZZZ
MKLVVFLLIFASIIIGVYLFKNKKPTVSPKIITTHEEAFSVVLKQLTDEYAISEEDIKDLYVVSVKKYLTPHFPLSTVNDQKPQAKDYLHFWVMIESVLVICEENESIYDGLGMGVNMYGKIVYSTGSPLSSGESRKTGLMRWTPEKLEIKNKINAILKKHNKSSIRDYLSSSAGSSFYIIDMGSSFDIYQENAHFKTFDYSYNKSTGELIKKPEGPIRDIVPLRDILPYHDKQPEFSEVILYSPEKNHL